VSEELDEKTFDEVMSRIYGAANDAELAIIDEVLTRSGLMARCAYCDEQYASGAGPKCEGCGYVNYEVDGGGVSRFQMGSVLARVERADSGSHSYVLVLSVQDSSTLLSRVDVVSLANALTALADTLQESESRVE